MTIDFVTFRHKRDNYPVAVSLPDWSALEQYLSVHRQGEKDGPLFSPVTYKPEAKRGNDGVDSVNFAVFDIDHTTDEEIKALLSRLDDTPFIMYSTYSDSVGGDRNFRLIIPLPAPVKALQWRNKTREALIKRYKLAADPATKDPSRLYYLPSCPEGKTGIVYKGDGTPGALTTKERLYAKKGLTRTIALGEPLADVNNRDSTMQKAAGVLAFMFPEKSDEELLAIITPSLSRMPSDHPLDFELDKFREKLVRARARKEKKDEEQAAQAKEFEKFVSPEGAEVDPDSVLAPRYTEEETRGFNPRHWIIQHGSAYFFWVNGKYTSAKSREELGLSIVQYLAKAPIIRKKIGANGKPLPLDDSSIVKANGTLADHYECSLVAPESYFDAATSTFVEALAPLRPFSPIFHKDVDTWLRALGGKQADKLLDWVAGVTKLNYQCCALLLEGDSGAGKGLLASGLSALWSDSGPSSIDVITGDWNSSLTKCPFVLADEGLPNTYKGSINDLLRQAIGSSNITLQRKYLPSSTIKGSIRLLMSSNNANMLKGFEDIGPEDRVAIAQRILLVEVHDGVARGLLESLPVETRDNWAQQAIAEHALYLRDTRKITRGKRFLVEGDGNELTDRLTVSAGAASDMLELLVQTLSELNTKPSNNIIILPGKVLVSAAIYSNSNKWEAIVGSFKKPSSKQIKATLRNMSDSLEEVGGRKYYSVRVDLLDVWQKINQSDVYPAIRKAVLK